MCLGIPGQIESIQNDDPLTATGSVRFGDIRKSISLAYTPEAQVGDYVIVHAGFALSVIDEEEANSVFATLKELGEAIEDEIPR